MASLVLAPNASLASRLVSAGFYIDNLASEVVSFSSNVTNGVYSPGSSITIYILFSSPVSVVSYTILALHGDNASCSARYYGGNNTASLSFLYQTSESSGTCRLEYLNAGSLQGSILRFSEAPTLRANLQLELPGTRFSLGMTTSIIIDPSAARILQISVSSVATSRGILVMDSLAISTNNVDSTSIAFRMAQELFALPFNASSPLADIEAIITPTLPSPLQIMEDGFANIIIYNTVEHSLMSSPLWVDIISNRGQGGLEAQLQSYWWSSYTLSNVVDLILLTDREVLATDSYFTLMHSSNLNQARLTSAAQNYTLTVYKGSNDDLVDQYQLEYGGYLTQCVSSNAGSSGFMSLEAALEEIIPLRRLGITVHVILNSPMVLIYNIQLLRPASYPLRVILDNGMCPLAMPTSSVLMTSTVQLTYRYLIRDVTSLILAPNSFIPPGNYSIILDSNSGLYLSNFGVEANSIRYEYALNVAEGKLLSMIITNPAIPRLIATSVQFSALTPNTSTAIVASICFETGFQTGDMINITLPNFIGSSSSFTSSGSAFIMNVVNSTMDSSVHLVIIFLTNSTCFNMEMDESFGILTPLQAVYTIDSPFFVFSYLGTAGALANQPFNSVSTVAFASFDLTLGFPTYSSATSVSVQFQLVATFQASNGYISVVLPGFTSASSLDIYNLQIEGPFQYSLTVDWIQATNTLLITSLYDLDPFLCNFTIPLLSSQTLVVSPDGISELNPPTVAVSSVGWSMVATPLSYYPPVVGLLTATLNITVSRPLLELESVQIVAIFTRVLQGPATISVFLPDVYSVNGSTLLSFSTYNGTCVWHDWLHTLTLTLDSSWSGNTIILNLFNMSSLMSPGLNMRDSFTTTLLNSTIAFNASNAFLLPSSFTMVVPVPVIITSAIAFSSALFATNSIITVSASLNALAFPGNGDILDYARSFLYFSVLYFSATR